MNRNDVTEMIIEAKVRKGLKWDEIARKVGLSKEWVTAGCLGQMTFDAQQAATVAEIFGLPADTEVAAGGALQRLAADRRADRSADLPVL